MLAAMRLAALLALALSLGVAVPGVAAEPERTGRLLVSVERAAPGTVVASAAGRIDGVRVPEIGLVTVRPQRGESLAGLRRRLAADPRVRAVAVERRAAPRSKPNDPALSTPETAAGTPAGTPVQWWPQRMGLFDAWDLADGAGTLVATIDSGIDGTHPDLAPKVRDTLDVDPTVGAGGPTRRGWRAPAATAGCSLPRPTSATAASRRRSSRRRTAAPTRSS
jgi:subtilisin family serine protease